MNNRNIHITLWSPDYITKPYQEMLDELQHAFKKAMDMMTASATSKDDLFIFIAPEWLFINNKNKENNRCYTKEELTKIDGTLKKLTSNQPNILLVAGSIRLEKNIDPEKMKYQTFFSQVSKTEVIPLDKVKQMKLTKNSALIYHNGIRFKYNKKTWSQ